LTPSSRIGLLVGGPSLPAGRANDPDDQDEELFA
jgi:hypothetical protein